MRTHDARLFLRTGLWRSFAPDPTPARKPKTRDGRTLNVVVPDETALAVLRRYANGETLKALADEYAIKASLIRQWSNGLRPHLMLQIDKERRAGRP